MIVELVLWAMVSCLTSIVAAVLGAGGGLLLIGLMQFAVPAAALIPIHSAAQLVSNVSRCWFGRDYLLTFGLVSFLVGSLIGIGLAGLGWQWIDLSLAPIFIGLMMLWLTWGPGIKLPAKWSFFSLGVIQTGLGSVAGATGPLGSAVLVQRGANAQQVIITNSGMMSLTHGLKLILFTGLGVIWWQYWQLILALGVGALSGSWLGTRIRTTFAEVIEPQSYLWIIKWMITGFALWSIIKVVI